MKKKKLKCLNVHIDGHLDHITTSRVEKFYAHPF